MNEISEYGTELCIAFLECFREAVFGRSIAVFLASKVKLGGTAWNPPVRSAEQECGATS